MIYIFLSLLIWIGNPKIEQISEKISTVIRKLPSSTKSSIYIIDADTGFEIFNKDSDISMIPASNTKLFTTAAALNLMGSNYELSTKILISLRIIFFLNM